MKRLLTTVLSAVLILGLCSCAVIVDIEELDVPLAGVIGQDDIKNMYWVQRQAPTTCGYEGIAFGNGLFVVVGDTMGTRHDRIVTSTDGINWTARSAPSDAAWASVAYGNNRFVAVAWREGYDGSYITGQKIMYSTDGNTWRGAWEPVNASWRSVTYGNGRFVAVGNGAAMTSTDGVNWTQVTVPARNWQSVTYGNNMFVAVAIDGDRAGKVMTSTNGLTWTSRTAANDSGWYGVTYGNNMFIAVAVDGSTNNRIMRSTNGTSWTAVASPNNTPWRRIAYGNGLFIAVGEDNGTDASTIFSTNGSSWSTKYAANRGYTWEHVGFGNGMFIAVNDDYSGNSIMTLGTAGTGRGDLALKITNVNTDGEALSGGVFEVKGMGRTVSITHTGNSVNNIITNIQNGDYKITNTTPARGYKLNTEIKEIKADIPYGMGTQYIEVRIVSEPITIEITKQDIEEMPVGGAQFLITKKAEEGLDMDVRWKEYVDIPDGSKTVNLSKYAFGTYLVTEIMPPSGYELDSEPREFEISSGKVVPEKLVVTNISLTAIFEKVSAVTGEMLDGAWFRMTRTAHCDDENHKHTLGAAIDESELLEESEDDEESTEEEDFADTATSDGTSPLQEQEETAVTEETEESLLQKDEENDDLNGLPGEPEEAYEEGGDVIHIESTGQETEFRIDGGVHIYYLAGSECGTYEIKEIRAPRGYLLDPEPQTIFLSGYGAVTPGSLMFENKPYELNLINICGDTGEKLNGAQYIIRYIQDDEECDEECMCNDVRVTTYNGEFNMDLPGWCYGKYEIEQIQPPDGYMRNNEKQYFEILSDATENFDAIVFTNVPHKLYVEKVDADNGMTLTTTGFHISGMDKEIDVSAVNGTFTLNLAGWQDGIYEVKEIIPPEGYLLDSDPQEFELKTGVLSMSAMVFTNHSEPSDIPKTGAASTIVWTTPIAVTLFSSVLVFVLEVYKRRCKKH